MKKYIYIWLALLSDILNYKVFAAESLSSEELQEQMTPTGTENVVRATGTDEEAVDGVLGFVRDTMFDLLLLIAVWVFLYIWGKLLMARWNPEELKKAFTGLVNAGIWLFVVAAAYALVTFIAWIDIL